MTFFDFKDKNSIRRELAVFGACILFAYKFVSNPPGVPTQFSDLVLKSLAAIVMYCCYLFCRFSLMLLSEDMLVSVSNTQTKSFYPIKKGMFLTLLFLYSVMSFLAFIFTSGGWTAFIFFMLGGFIFFVTNFILSCILIIKQDKDTLFISKSWIIKLIAIQSVALLFNSGDNGDGGGGFSFFEVLLGIKKSSPNPALLGDFAGVLTIIFVSIYIVFLVTSLSLKEPHHYKL